MYKRGNTKSITIVDTGAINMSKKLPIDPK
jgi:hypothetical protein